MRLAQLARKIATKPAEIVTFLASRNLPVDDSSNAKVTDEQVLLVFRHYAPELLEVNTTDELTVEEPLVVTTEELAEQTPEEQETSSDEIEAAEVEQPLVSEVIKPVKVELPGLKVVGKIDLPEPKKKEVDSNNPEEEALEKGDLKSKSRQRKNPRVPRDEDRRPRKNSIALQREREARERLRRKQEESIKEKELKTQRYLKKVSKYTAPPKPMKRNKHEEEYEVLVENKEQPKTWLGKIFGWFVSE